MMYYIDALVLNMRAECSNKKKILKVETIQINIPE